MDDCAATPLFGNRTTLEINVLGRKVIALLDTGSELSILPVGILQQALGDGIDIDTEVKELILPEAATITDASGTTMKFLTAVELPVKDESDGQEVVVKMFVSMRQHDTVIIGTNAIPAMGYKISKIMRKPEDEKQPTAVVAGRVYTPSGEAGFVKLKNNDLMSC